MIYISIQYKYHKDIKTYRNKNYTQYKGYSVYVLSLNHQQLIQTNKMPLFSPTVDTNYCHYNIFYNCEISFSHTCTNQTSLIINGLMKYLKKKFNFSH